MFGFGFDDLKNIYQTKGCLEDRDMSCYLIENRLTDIQDSFN